MTLKVAIVHYHLKPGGVTRVIESAVAALGQLDIKPAILHGEPHREALLAGERYVARLGYSESTGSPKPEELYDSLIQAARAELGALPDLWHIHNHSLGKNPALTAACRLLAENGHRLMLQIHDFPEDGRPANYRKLFKYLKGWRETPENAPYPTASQIHYAVLNPRDAGILKSAGMPENRLHILPNPISLPEANSGAEEGQFPKLEGGPLTLYPTRGIRRKNLGEFLLWATLAEKGERFATTLAPENPMWQPRHDRWAQFGKELNIPADFSVLESHGGPFFGWLAAADQLITTSVAEGFGMAFLESFLLGKSLVGRDLPEITADFGIDLSELYERLDIPLELVDEQGLRERLQKAMQDFYHTYGRRLPENAVERAMSSMVKEGNVDFGRLDEPLQEAVIKSLLENPDLRSEMRPSVLSKGRNDKLLSENRRIVLGNYSLESYGARLAKIYKALCEKPTETPRSIDHEKLLDGFLRPETFSLLRC